MVNQLTMYSKLKKSIYIIFFPLKSLSLNIDYNKLLSVFENSAMVRIEGSYNLFTQSFLNNQSHQALSNYCTALMEKLLLNSHHV